MSVTQAYKLLFEGALIVLLLLIGAMVIRSIIGPRSTDRIMSVNMLSTMTICCITILSVLLGEGYLADVAMIYAMISFVAVLMMASMFIPPDPKHPNLPVEREEKKENTAAAPGKGDGGQAQEKAESQAAPQE